MVPRICALGSAFFILWRKKMKELSGNQVRQMFLDYFAQRGHMVEPGASLIPLNDPTLLWINAGVAALKKYFDGREKPRSNRICNAQKSIRTNDIENVGKTARHHTFFEMLGNFSIGDYFKEDALKFAWEFLTSENWIGFDPKRLYVTVYTDDEEAYRIWTEEIKIDPSHILKTYDNFWQIGEGPCGPDSEIFYDRGEKYDPEHLGEKLFFEEMENDRYIEVWNIVFSQFDAKEGVDRKDFKELPQKNIDTGMGLERLVALIQEGETNFDTDLFLPIIHEIEKIAKYPYSGEYKIAYRVIADHIRTVTFALSDGATFSNEGRGYVLRRVLRRACRYARVLGIEKPFMYKLVDNVCDIMKEFYPYLLEKKDFVKKLINKEEEAFLQTLNTGEKLLQNELAKAKDGILSGEVIFKLYDTYGYPKEITIEVAEENGLKCDLEGFEKCMERQRELARSSRDVQESMHNQSKDLLDLDTDFLFTGYTNHMDTGTVVALFKDGKRVDVIEDEGDVVLDKSCFYAESGGQIADTGILENDDVKLEVVDVKKAPNGQFLHHVKVLEGRVLNGIALNETIDYDRRLKIMANHSSLHLLQSALREVLGNHVTQAGSYVSDAYARFDFTHFEKINYRDLLKIEELVNSYINAEYPVTTEVLSIEEAKKTDAIVLFDEKYEDEVRVVSMGNVSKEFCGGTHVSNTSKLGSFKIVSEESIGSGIRRIECVTKMVAYEDHKKENELLNSIKDRLDLKNINAIYDKINAILNEQSNLNGQIKRLKEKLLNTEADKLISTAKQKDDKKYLIMKLDSFDQNLKDYATALQNKLNGLVFIVNVNDDKLSFVAACNKDWINDGIKANNLVKFAASLADGKGGGKDDIAQAGGKNLNNVDEILRKVENEVL